MNSSQRNCFIDILRAVAIFGTLYQHTLFTFTNSQKVYWEAFGHKIYYFIFANGWLGVNVFFMLSGVVLCRLSIIQDKASILAYYKTRFFRLVPFLVILLLFVDITVFHSYKRFLFNLLIVPTGLFNLIPSYWTIEENGVLWSIGVELLFSLLLPFLLMIIRRASFTRFFVCVLVFCFLYRIIGDHVWFTHIRPDYKNLLANPLKDTIFGRLDDFITGMLIAKLVIDKKTFSKKLVVLAIATLLADMYAWNYIWAAPQRTIPVSILASSAHTALALSCCVLIVNCINYPIWERKAFSFLVFTGQICYSLYIMHWMIWKHLLKPGLQLRELALFVFMAYTSSILTFIFIELPWIRRKPAWTAWLLPKS
jgi:peptidoglycan/LPS O-acetylase OafA/YrhL